MAQRAGAMGAGKFGLLMGFHEVFFVLAGDMQGLKSVCEN